MSVWGGKRQIGVFPAEEKPKVDFSRLHLLGSLNSLVILNLCARSSADRALACGARCRRFDSYRAYWWLLMAKYKSVLPVVVALVWLLLAVAVWAVEPEEQDISAPVIVWLEISPQFVDTSDRAQAVTVTLRITDDLAGLDRYQVDFVSDVAPSQRVILFRQANATRIDGDERDGIYQGQIVLPQYSAYGRWQVVLLCAHDQINNWVCDQERFQENAQIDTWILNGPASELPNSVWLPLTQK